MSEIPSQQSQIKISQNFQSMISKVQTIKSHLQSMIKGKPLSKDNHDQQQPIKRLEQIVNQFKISMINYTSNPARQLIDQKFQKLKKKLQSPLLLQSQKNLIQKWVGQLMKIAVQEAHRVYFQNGNESEMRLTFATFVLEQHRKYTLQLSKIDNKQLDMSKLEDYFKNASDGTIEYLQYKFQSSAGKVADMRLGNIIKQTGKIINSQYDLIRRSGLNINIVQKKSIVTDVKKFLNAIINECQSKNDMWKTFVEQIFNVPGEVPMKIEQGTKIKMNTPMYTEEELNSEGFFVTGNQIMRVLMKWIEELIDIYQNPERSLNSKGGFRINFEQQMRMLSNTQKQVLWGKLQYFSKILKKLMQALKKQIRQITSKIIQVSEKNIDKFQYLDKNVLSMLMISQNIWKSLENYMMDTLAKIFQLFLAIRLDYQREKRLESDIQVFTFTLGDLLRCRCSGTKEQILQVWANLKKKEEDKEIKILRVKNRLNQPTSDFLINFAFQDPNKCFLICQMQIGLKKQKSIEQDNDNHAYHFMHFLYEMARSPHGVIIELAVKLYQIDNRKKFIAKHSLKFQVSNSQIQLKWSQLQKKYIYTCNKCEIRNLPKNAILDSTINRLKTYICHYCQKLIPSCKFYFDPIKCKEQLCRNLLCPLCYFNKIKQMNYISNTIVNDKDQLEKYFKPIRNNFNHNKINKIKEILDSNFNTMTVPILAITYCKYYYGHKKTQIIKKIEKQNKYVKAFTNQLFKIEEEMRDSIILISKPIFQPQPITREQISEDFSTLINSQFHERAQSFAQFKLKYDVLDYSVFTKFKEGKQNIFYKMKNETDNKICIVNYDKEGNSDLEKDIADQMMKELVDKINKKNKILTKLELIKIKTSFKEQDIMQKDKILDIEIEQAHLRNNKQLQQFQFLSMFTSTQILSIYNSPHYNYHSQYSFDSTLQELTIKNCNLSLSFNNNYKHLQKIDLSNNQLKQIPDFTLENIEYINLSNNYIRSINEISFNFSKLRRIIVRGNRIKELPRFNLPSLEYLNMAENEIESFASIEDFETKRLKSLNLSNNNPNNKLSKQLPSLSNLPQLLQLTLSNCKIDKIAPLGCQKLKTLKLDRNIIESTKQFQNLNLDYLNLSHNRIDQNGLGDLLSIEGKVVELYGNQFKSFEKNIKCEWEMVYVQKGKWKEQQQQKEEGQKGMRNENGDLPVCNICLKEIEGKVMLYDEAKNVKVCKRNDQKHQNVDLGKMIELVRIEGFR